MSRHSHEPCCAQNDVKTAQALTNVSVLLVSPVLRTCKTRPAGVESMLSVPETVSIHPSKKWHRCDRRSDRAFITTNAKLRFLTFRLTLKRTGRDKKLETIFSFLRSTVFCLCKWRCARHVRRRTKCATQFWSNRSRHREHCLNEERRLCPMHALSCVCDLFFFPSRACALQNH